MLPRDYRNRISQLEKEQDLLAGRITKLREDRRFLTGISYDGIRVQTSASGSSNAQEITERIIDLERQYELKCMEIDELTKEFCDVISGLDPRYSELLHARWIENKSLYDYAVSNHYSYERIKHIHNEAIREFEKTTPNSTK